jgi:cell shape-determining protein MreC
MEGVAIPIVAVLSVFIGFPAILFSFISGVQKRKTELRKLELEIEKQNSRIKLLEEENRKYDKLIHGGNE